MPKILVYSSTFCPYCSAAKALLERKGVPFSEVNLDELPPSETERVVQLTGRTTVPQVFIGDRHVGGFTDLQAADQSGDLDNWLAEANGQA